MTRILHQIFRACLGLCLLAGPAVAQSTLSVGMFTQRQPLFASTGFTGTGRHDASLFGKQDRGNLFTALPGRLDLPYVGTTNKASQLRDLIARAEAGPAGYDAVQLGARVKPPKPPTQMTLAEIYAWIDDTPGQPHAIGRYQFIPPTLRHSAKRLGLRPQTRFSPAIQDQLADLLLEDAGFDKMENGDMRIETFMLNLAKIWAGLPVPSGRSYYEGVAGNKAVLSYETYAHAVRKIMGPQAG